MKLRIVRIVTVALFIITAAITRAGAAEDTATPRFVKLFDVIVENKVGGEIRVEKTGAPPEIVGSVLAAAGAVNPKGYTASGWAEDSAVAAVAVNAIHIRVRQGAETGVIFSLLPREFYQMPQDYKSYYNSSSSIMTDISAGAAVFGGSWSPFVGSAVEKLSGADWSPLPADYVPAEGDTFRISVERLEPAVMSIEFDNSFGGPVTVNFVDGASKIVAQVFKPVAGVGRFDGSLYADVGRLRANHTGVVCVSTSPVGQIGGFQIIPDKHGMSAEMKFARTLTQWMVVGPLNYGDPSTAGSNPLFSAAIRPVYHPVGGRGRTIEQMLDSYIVQARIGGGPWTRMPTVTGRVDDALANVSHIRILFPIEADFLKE